MLIEKPTTKDMIKRARDGSIHENLLDYPKSMNDILDSIYEFIINANSIEESLKIASDFKKEIDGAVDVLEGFNKIEMMYPDKPISAS